MVKQSGSTSTRGILHAAAGRDKFSLSRFEPGEKLKPFVEHYWLVRYDLPAGAMHTQTVLSYPNVHLAFEEDEGGRRALVYGIPRRPFVRSLRGSGKTLGVRFRAGGFQPFWQQDVALLTGKTIPASDVFGPQADGWVHAVLDAGKTAANAAGYGGWAGVNGHADGDAGNEQAMAEMAETLLSTRLPEPDPRSELAAGIVREAMEDRTIIKVEQLGERAGMSLRQLQRLFRRYVGVSPKWVIKRFRLQEAAERIEQDASTPWTELAAQLGYFDQAHFIKDFKSVLGQTPAEYRLRRPGD